MTDTPCPDPETLGQFLLGCLEDDRSQEVESHFASCPHCFEQAEQLQLEDTLTNALSETDTRIDQFIQSVTAADSKTVVSDQVTSSSGTSVNLSFLTDPEAEDELGRLNGYRILEVIGKGGMGLVLLAEDLHLHRKVALKVIKPEVASDDVMKERFLREARASAALTHDNIVTVYQVGEENGVLFLAMQLLEGETLDSRLKREGTLPEGEAVRMAQETALALRAAHNQGLTHRDIKPDNIWLEAGSNRVKILDFGLASVVNDDSHLTQSGIIVGTPSYVSPEQAEGRRVDQRADLFSLGVVLYRMLTGASPFARSTLLGTLGAIGNYDPEPPHMLNGAVSKELSDLVTELLEKDPEQRLGSADEFLQRLEQVEANQATDAVAHHGQPKSPSYATGWKPLLISSALAFVLLLGIVTIQFRTPTGEWKLDVYDQDVRVVVTEGDNIVKDLQVAAEKKGEVTLSVGTYDVRIESAGSKLVLAAGSVEVQRDGKVLASLKLQESKPVGQQSIENALVAQTNNGAPLSVLALTATPAKLDGVESWSLETLPIAGGVVSDISPDGKLVATFSDDGMIRLWDSEALKLKSILVGHLSGPPRIGGLGNSHREFVRQGSLQWSPNGTKLASVDASGTLIVWAADTGFPIGVFRFANASAEGIAWSPDGSLLAARFDDHFVRVVNEQGKLLSELEHPTNHPRHMTWAPDSTQLAVSLYRDDQLYIWNVSDGTGRHVKLPQVVYPDDRGMNSLAWSPNGEWIAVSHQNLVTVYGVLTGIIREVLDHSGALAWSIDSDELFVGMSEPGQPNQLVKIGMDDPGEVTFTKLKHEVGQPITAITPLPDGHHLFLEFFTSGGTLLDLQSTEERQFKSGYPAISHDGSTCVLSSSMEPAVSTVIDALTNDPKQRSLPFSGPTSIGHITASDRFIAINYKHNCQIIDRQTGRPLDGLTTDAGWSNDTVISPSGQKVFVVARSMSTIRSLETGKVLAQCMPQRPNGTPMQPEAACFSPDGSEIAMVGNGDIAVIDATDGNLKRHLSTEFWGYDVAWSHDGRMLAVADNRKSNGTYGQYKVRIFDPTVSTELTVLEDFPESGGTGLRGLIWSPDGSYLAATADFGSAGDEPDPRWLNQLVVWETKSWKKISTRPIAALDLRFGKDGQLSYLTHTGDVITLNVMTKQDIKQIATETASDVTSFSLDGQFLYKVIGDRIQCWNLETEQLQTTLIPRLGNGWAVVSPDGHYEGPEQAHEYLRYVVKTKEGTSVLTPFEFRNKFGWRNDPAKAKRSL